MAGVRRFEAPKAIPPHQYELYESLILTGQIAQERVPSLLGANPEFAAWYRARRTLAPDAGEGEV